MKLVTILGLCVCVSELLASADLNIVGINDFLTTCLIPEALNQTTNGNVIVSPFSLLVPFAELILASEGDCRAALSELLRSMNGDLDSENPLESFDDETIFRKFSPLKKVLIEDNNEDGVALETHSRIYVSNKKKLNKSFIKQLERGLGSKFDIKSISYKWKKPALAKMNKWVKRSTRGNIKRIISDYEADPLAAIFLNTVFFKAPWRHQFQRVPGRKAFFLNNTYNVPVRYMELSASLGYAECPEIDSKLLKIPYQYKKDISLIIVLPNKVKEASDLAPPEPSINTSKILARALDYMRPKYVNLLLPRFKASSEIDFDTALDLMASIYLQNDCTLTKLLKPRSFLSVYPALQKVYYEVNEASESTHGSGSGESDSGFHTVEFGAPSKWKGMEFNVDRPFQFLVRVEDFTVLAGIVRNPQYD